MSSAAHPAPSAAAAAAARAGRGGRAAARAAPEVADAAVVDVERAEGGGRQAQRDAQQRAQDGLVRDHEVHAAGRLEHLCAARARGVAGARARGGGGGGGQWAAGCAVWGRRSVCASGPAHRPRRTPRYFCQPFWALLPHACACVLGHPTHSEHLAFTTQLKHLPTTCRPASHSQSRTPHTACTVTHPAAPTGAQHARPLARITACPPHQPSTAHHLLLAS